MQPRLVLKEGGVKSPVSGDLKGSGIPFWYPWKYLSERFMQKKDFWNFWVRLTIKTQRPSELRGKLLATVETS